jgi:hypothetical protein
MWQDDNTTVALDCGGDIQTQGSVEGEDHDTRLRNDIFHSERAIAKSVPESKSKEMVA